jgi:hypothetical protein
VAFTIRDRQITVLRERRYEDFERRLLSHLRKHHSACVEGFSDDDIRAYIRICYERAVRVYGLTTEQAVACYAQIPLLLGGDFEVNPDCRTVADLLGRLSFEPNTRAKMALATAYWIRNNYRQSMRPASG